MTKLCGFMTGYIISQLRFTLLKVANQAFVTLLKLFLKSLLLFVNKRLSTDLLTMWKKQSMANILLNWHCFPYNPMLSQI